MTTKQSQKQQTKDEELEQKQQQQCENVKSKLKEVSKVKGEVKKEIQSWAETLEEQFNRGDRSKVQSIGKICSFMVNQVKDAGIPENQYAYFYEVLDRKYKNPYSKDLSHLDRPNVNETPESILASHCFKDATNKLKELAQKEYDENTNTSHSKHSEYLTREQLAGLRDDVDEVRDAINNVCETHKIATIDTNNEDTFPDNNKPEKISLEAAPIPKSERIRKLQEILGKALYKMSKDCNVLGDSITKMNYISDNPKVNEGTFVGAIAENIDIIAQFLTYLQQHYDKDIVIDFIISFLTTRSMFGTILQILIPSELRKPMQKKFPNLVYNDIKMKAEILGLDSDQIIRDLSTLSEKG